MRETKSQTKKTRESSADSPAKQVSSFIAKFEPALAKLVRAARTVLRKRYPTALELVYDNYNALAIGYSTTERTSDVMFSLAVYPRGLNLYFMYGKFLPDPKHLLEGSGNQGAFVRVNEIDQLDHPEVKALLIAAVKQAEPRLPTTGGGHTIVKMISAKQRPRRPNVR